MKRGKRGVSPIIATVLLIAIVIVLVLIIFLWARGFIKEAVTKQGKPAYQACDEATFQALIVGSQLQIVNNGQIPMNSLQIKKKSGGSIQSQIFNESIGVGMTKAIEIGAGWDEVEVVPVILGKTSKGGTHEYVCEANGHVAEI